MMLDDRGVRALGKVSEESKPRSCARRRALRALAARRELRHGPDRGLRRAAPPWSPRTSPATATSSATASTACSCRAGDALALAEALRALALDGRGGARMARAARERAERFAWPRVAAEVVDVYEQAIASAAPPARARARSPCATGCARRPAAADPARAPAEPRARARSAAERAPARVRTCGALAACSLLVGAGARRLLALQRVGVDRVAGARWWPPSPGWSPPAWR